MDLLANFTTEEWVEIVAGIIIPLVLFILNSFSIASINKKIIYKSPRDRLKVMFSQIVSFILLMLSIVLFEYSIFIMFNKTQSYIKTGIALSSIIFVIGFFLISKFEKPSSIIINTRSDKYRGISIIATIIMILLFGLIAFLYIGFISIIVGKSFLCDNSIQFVLGCIFFLLSLIFSSDCKALKEDTSYVVNSIRIWTKSYQNQYEISSKIKKTKNSICFYYEEDYEQKNVVIPMHEIAQIEYIIDPEHTLGAERRKILEERRAKKEMKKEMKKHK